jgi:signal transduction histidine kinase
MTMASQWNAPKGVSTRTLTNRTSRRRRTTADGAPAAQRRAVLLELSRLERLFEQNDRPDPRVFVRARKAARARAMEVLERGGVGAEDSRTALLVAAAELFGALRTELVASPTQAARTAHEFEVITGLPRLALAREILRSPELLTLLPTTAIESQLEMLVVLAQLRSASVWILDDAEHVTCLRHAGDGSPTRGAKELAGRLLAGESTEPGDRRLLLGVRVGRWQQPLAALVGSARPGIRGGRDWFLAEAVPMLSAILERDALLAGNAASERALVQSSERKLTRLGFDLHDGPIQDVAVIGEDLRLFREQLDVVTRSSRNRALMLGRLDDLDAQLAGLDEDLRRISNEVRAASVLLNRPFARALGDVTRSFALRTTMEPQVNVSGDLSLISGSQQIALLNIVHEALTNVREHSNATEVEVNVSVNDEGVEAQITDNGRGFDLDTTLMRAAQRGRLGLIAMHERVRLLGGQCRIDSRPGGPTVVSVALERWEPLIDEAHRPSPGS